MKSPTNPILHVVTGLLLSGNIFFIKRLVDQLDSIALGLWEQKAEIAILKISHENLKRCIKKHYGEKIHEERRDPAE